MKCPECGSELNHHADKIDYSTATARPDAIDVELGGVINEIHTCPECGRVAARIAS
jgi:ribosomal protein S27AE